MRGEKIAERFIGDVSFRSGNERNYFLSLSNKNAFLTFIFPFNQGDTKMEDAKKRLCTVWMYCWGEEDYWMIFEEKLEEDLRVLTYFLLKMLNFKFTFLIKIVDVNLKNPRIHNP